MRYFTLQEAEALLPTVSKIMGEARDLKAQVEAKAAKFRDNTSPSVAERALTQGQVDFLVSQIDARLNDVLLLGARPTDVDKGLVDFPARLDGREVNLCWQLGEPRIDYWHGLEEGFPGRKPLRVPGRSPR